MGGFQCGDSAALIAYVYDECEAAERESIGAHVAGCAVCGGEVEALSGARQLLAGWAPPEVPLGFRVTSETWRPSSPVDGEPGAEADGVREPDGGVRRAGWWRQPLPAWAQAVAAAVIFAAGLAVGVSQAPTRAAVGARAPSPSPAAVAALEARLGAVEQAAAARPVASVTPAPAVDAAALMGQVRSEIAASERRMQGELAIRILQVANEMNQQQRLNTDQVQASLLKDFNGLVTLVAAQR
jgi:hypothetical protein